VGPLLQETLKSQFSFAKRMGSVAGELNQLALSNAMNAMKWESLCQLRDIDQKNFSAVDNARASVSNAAKNAQNRASQMKADAQNAAANPFDALTGQGVSPAQAAVAAVAINQAKGKASQAVDQAKEANPFGKSPLPRTKPPPPMPAKTAPPQSPNPFGEAAQKEEVPEYFPEPPQVRMCLCVYESACVCVCI
jgi:hypothetical protein